jgi:hypothetical protein
MNLGLDHIFVCAALGAPEAQTLVDAGFIEGTGNIHPGQGTSNRRFFFAHGFLELLWVHDEAEACSALTAPTRLWQRWLQRGTGANPFGICFSSPTVADHPLPFGSRVYAPLYLPSDKRIYFAQDAALSEPELFALSWPQALPAAVQQPQAHRLPLAAMQSVSIGLVDLENLSKPLRAAKDAGLVQVHRSISPELVLTFSSPHAIHLHLPSLAITLIGLPQSAN